MTDWTPIATAAIAGSSGIVGAGLGYLTARYQSNVEIRRIQSELDKVRIEHGEEHLRHRQAVYHDFLDSVHRFHASNAVEPFENLDEFNEWVRTFEHRLTAVSLFGTEEAWRAAQSLEHAIKHAAAADAYGGEPEQRLMKAWDETIEAMRPDTSPQERAR